MTLLIDAEIDLNHHVRVELSDGLRRIRAAIERLDAEIPGDERTSHRPEQNPALSECPVAPETG